MGLLLSDASQDLVVGGLFRGGGGEGAGDGGGAWGEEGAWCCRQAEQGGEESGRHLGVVFKDCGVVMEVVERLDWNGGSTLNIEDRLGEGTLSRSSVVRA